MRDGLYASIYGKSFLYAIMWLTVHAIALEACALILVKTANFPNLKQDPNEGGNTRMSVTHLSSETKIVVYLKAKINPHLTPF